MHPPLILIARFDWCIINQPT